MSNNHQFEVDYASIASALQNYSPVGIFGFSAGYCLCRLCLGERKWRKSPKEEKMIYGSVGGAFLTVIMWSIITGLKMISSEANKIISANEITLIWLFLIIGSGIQLILIFFDVSLKRKK